MANITEEHLHHMAKRHHQAMQTIDKYREKAAAFAARSIGTIEMGAGAWLGGMLEGRTAGGALPGIKIPLNLFIGAGLMAVGHFNVAGDRWSDDLVHLGNGFVGSYLAATGYAFGKRWRDTGKIFGGFQGAPFIAPYEDGWPGGLKGGKPGVGWDGAVSGDLSEAQMANIVQRMQQAAAYG